MIVLYKLCKMVAILMVLIGDQKYDLQCHYYRILTQLRSWKRSKRTSSNFCHINLAHTCRYSKIGWKVVPWSLKIYIYINTCLAALMISKISAMLTSLQLVIKSKSCFWKKMSTKKIEIYFKANLQILNPENKRF